MYSISGDAKGINYEWQGVPSVVNTPDELTVIQIDNFNASIADSIYQDITIWSFEENEVTLQFTDETRITFQKLGFDAG